VGLLERKICKCHNHKLDNTIANYSPINDFLGAIICEHITDLIISKCFHCQIKDCKYRKHHRLAKVHGCITPVNEEDTEKPEDTAHHPIQYTLQNTGDTLTEHEDIECFPVAQSVWCGLNVRFIR